MIKEKEYLSVIDENKELCFILNPRKGCVFLQEKVMEVIREVKKAVIGKDVMIEKVLMVVLAQGHILLEDIPGVGKTTMALAFSKAMDLDYKRVQFTPEIMPADVVGFSIFNKQSGKLEYQPGAALCNLFLADEINRTSSKTQSALLQAMEESKVTVDGITHQLPRPYTVIATQNPVGSAGTQLLPESQMDRFMARLCMGYPSAADEVEILKSRRGNDPLSNVQKAVTAEEICQMQDMVEEVYIHDDIYTYITRLIAATRQHPMLRLGASPRGSLALTRMGRAAAWLSGRDFVVPEDIKRVFFDVIEHRLVLGPSAKMGQTSAHSILMQILQTVTAPQITK